MSLRLKLALRRVKSLGDEVHFLKSIIDQLPVAIFCKDATKNFQLTIWNKTAEKLWGISAADAIGSVDEDFFPKDQAEYFRNVDINTLALGKIVDIPEEPIDTPTRGRLYLHTLKVPVAGPDNVPRYLLGISQDITQKKLAEEQLNIAIGKQEESLVEIRRQQDLVRAHEISLLHASKMTSLGEMAGGIAHEINNPLAIIKGHADQLMRLGEDGNLDASRIAKSAEKISSTTDRIAKIIRGLRSFARDGSGDPFQPARISQILEETMEFCRARFLSRGVELIIEPIEADVSIECRPVQISQVLLNILNNAFDAVVEASDGDDDDPRWVRVSVKSQTNFVVIAIADSGPGIPEALKDKIMQPFFTTKDVGKGSGLGLSVAAGIIKTHGGRLYLDPKSAQTRFVIELPHRQAHETHET